MKIRQVNLGFVITKRIKFDVFILMYNIQEDIERKIESVTHTLSRCNYRHDTISKNKDIS